MPTGSLDEPVVELVKYINESKDYYTTSSCSGRISVFVTNQGKAKGGKWILVEHATITHEQLVVSLRDGGIQVAQVPSPTR
jgi:tRNA wybutosine-synthesizing protein 3